MDVILKSPLVIGLSKYIVVSEVHKLAIEVGIKVICGELNLMLTDLPMLNCFNSQKNALFKVLNLSNASHFGAW